jgi:predicted aldo/keto reductase-like oxidoreductase
MRQVVLGKTGLTVSAVGVGGIPIQRVSLPQAVKTFRAALDLGINFIDTAAAYSDSQTKIGAAIKGRRDGLVIASKSGQKTKDGILADVERTRKEMGCETIDLYQFHNISTPQGWAAISGPGGAMEGLLQARDKGHIAHIGFTSHNLAMALKLIHEPVFETIQFSFNLVTAEAADKLIPQCRKNKLGFIAMKPLCGGQYDNVAFAFKYLNAFPDVVPIPGVESPEQIRQIVDIVNSGATLKGREKVEADKITATLGKLFCRRCGYCQPCPQGVPIANTMVFEGFLRRFPLAKILEGPGKGVIENSGLCNECGLCEEKCPYHLPIRQTIKRMGELARKFAAQHSRK